MPARYQEGHERQMNGGLSFRGRPEGPRHISQAIGLGNAIHFEEKKRGRRDQEASGGTPPDLAGWRRRARATRDAKRGLRVEGRLEVEMHRSLTPRAGESRLGSTVLIQG